MDTNENTNVGSSDEEIICEESVSLVNEYLVNEHRTERCLEIKLSGKVGDNEYLGRAVTTGCELIIKIYYDGTTIELGSVQGLF